MQLDLIRADVVAFAGDVDQLFRYLGSLLAVDGPTNDFAAENVEDHVQVQPDPWGWADESGDVP